MVSSPTVGSAVFKSAVIGFSPPVIRCRSVAVGSIVVDCSVVTCS